MRIHEFLPKFMKMIYPYDDHRYSYFNRSDDAYLSGVDSIGCPNFLPSFCVEAMEYDSSYYHRSNQIHTIPTSLILISILLLLLHLTPPPPFIPSYHHRVASSALLLLMRVVASTTCDRYSCFLVTGLLFRIACRANNNIVDDDHSYS